MKKIAAAAFALCLLSGCASADYYNSDKYRIKERQKESMKMFEKTREVRRKCGSKPKKPSSRRRRRYYS